MFLFRAPVEGQPVEILIDTDNLIMVEITSSRA